jgi:uncharacterized repeat protein (TIGR03806 family)
MRRAITIVALVALLGACEQVPVPDPTFHDASAIPERLSEWGVVYSRDRQFGPNAGVFPYDLNTPLFTDYALKLRTVWMPDGTIATYNDERELDFPVGTIISKTFYYEKAPGWSTNKFQVIRADRESPLKSSELIDLARYVLMETRLLVHYEEGWKALPYVWNDEQNEAFLAVAGDQRPIALVDENGSDEIFYIVPDTNQCSGCHVTDHTAKEIRPIGPKAWQLNREYSWWNNDASQLENWTAGRLLEGFDGTAPEGVRWSRPGDATLEQRARAYLDANCAHCHNPRGAADTSALHLNIDAPVDRLYGVCKTPVAVGRGSGDRPFDIYPGRPGDSIMIFRMEHTDPAIAMPELGRSAAHREGVHLVAEWIASMNGEC